MTEPARLLPPTPPRLTFPPCPTCSAEVTDLIAEGAVEDRHLAKLYVTMMRAREPFKLVPCGHEVREYDLYDAKVLRWGL